jgi:hypothetical protein
MAIKWRAVASARALLDAQRAFSLQEALRVWPLDDSAIVRCFELMEQRGSRRFDAGT